VAIVALQEVRTFKNIQDEIIEYAKMDSNSTTVRNEVKRKINNFYQRIGFKRQYRWSAVHTNLLLRQRYTTGTVTATTDSDELVGSSTVWTEALHLHSSMKLGMFFHAEVR